MNKEKKKIVRRRFAWYGFRLFTFLAGKFPLSWSYFLGSVVGAAAFVIARRHREVALKSLAIAFPNQGEGDYKRIARDSFVFMAQSALELLYCLKSLNALRTVTIEGKEHLDAALAKGKGALLVNAHLGNFPLLSLKLAQEGYVVNIVARPMRDKKTDEHVHQLRTNAGIKTILSYPRKACIMGIINSLRDNELVLIQMDQNFGTGGVWVKFFDRLAATPVGPIVLALRTGAAVVPVYIYRKGKGVHTIVFEKEVALQVTEEKDETVLLNVIQCTRVIEGWVRAFPEQWSWIHRRWKSRPSQEVKKQKFKIET